MKEEEYLKAIDNLPSQFEQLNIDTGKREPIYQEIFSEGATGESAGETEFGGTTPVSPIGPLNYTPEFLKPYSHIYDNIEVKGV